MGETRLRMTDASSPPSAQQVEAWIGSDAYGYWKRVTQFIAEHYPGVFVPEWLFGGKKHGWSLRYKKGRAFCTLIPEEGRLALLIVYGAEERARVEAIRGNVSEYTRRVYDAATTYHDGKWVLLNVDADETMADVERLLQTKRKPRLTAR